MLLAFAQTVRIFLMPHWERWHRAWGPPEPSTPSQWTCIRSSLLLAHALTRRGVSAELRSGRPIDGHDFGLLTDRGWESHAWVEAGDILIDITADQFGHEPIVIIPSNDLTYRPGTTAAARLPPSHAAFSAVADLWPLWCDHQDRDRSAWPNLAPES